MTLSINSKYKLFGGFGLLIGLNSLIGSGVFMLLTESKISVDKVDLLNDKSARIAYLILFGIFLLFLLLLITQCRRIVADKDGITFINPLFPFLRTTNNWTDFDYYITVDEDSKYSKHEAIWLIKNEKIKRRISSFYYSNYFDLLGQVTVKSKGKRYFDPFSQLFTLLRLKKNPSLDLSIFSPKIPLTWVFAKAGRTEAVFQLLFFNLASYRAGE